jgi:light-regulated signal transduction histidine kinase (bacteriophytochrome)
MKRFLETGESKVLNKTLELTGLRKDMTEFPISLTISRTMQQNETAFIAFLRDISKEKQIQSDLLSKTRQLEYKNIELERTNKELESFNYVASHDLQEPLRKIHTFTNRILEKPDDLSADHQIYFNKIISSSQRMQLLINDLLTFSQTSIIAANKEPMSLNKMMDEVKAALAHNIDEKSATIIYENLPVINVVHFQFVQLLTNLLSNALKYSRENQKPVVKISAEILLNEDMKPGIFLPFPAYTRIRMQDNGIGFESQYSEKIFDLFTRLHNKNKYSGTGIGLAICKKIVENHNGFISATSEPGVGSVFDVYLPYSDN